MTRILIALALGLALASGCNGHAEPAPKPARTEITQPRQRAPKLREHDTRLAIAKAQHWLDALEIDPIALREKGVKGKKKLVEQLDAYRMLLTIANAEDRPALIERVRRIAAVTYEPRFHDLLVVDDETFKQDATSYLRGAVILERIGLDTTLYRAEIHKIHARLNAHMLGRGVQQRLAFHWYFRELGLEEPFPLGTSVRGGVVARRLAPRGLSESEVYDLTHEILIPYEYGDKRAADPFDAGDKAYLRHALQASSERYVERREPDPVAELVACMRLMGFVDAPGYRHGLEFLLEAQNADGSWGDRERAWRAFGELGDVVIILHTTMVAVEALALADQG